MANKEELNNFFVSCFNAILRSEERALETLTHGKLTVKEIHFIEAVFKTQAVGENCFSTIAKYLGVTVGTLTTSYNKLAAKGLFYKEQDKDDKRIFYILPTPLAKMIYNEHLAFHERMIDRVVKHLSDEEMKTLTESLKKLDEFFHFYKDYKQ